VRDQLKAHIEALCEVTTGEEESEPCES
jgi:hypothetical protein